VSEQTDILELLRQKSARRQRLARLSFEEKIEIVRRLQKLSLMIRKIVAKNSPPRRARKSAANR
jgi:hypothetical protein